MFYLEKIEVKVTEYNIRNCPIRWRILTSIKSQLSSFS